MKHKKINHSDAFRTVRPLSESDRKLVRKYEKQGYREGEDFKIVVIEDEFGFYKEEIFLGVELSLQLIESAGDPQAVEDFKQMLMENGIIDQPNIKA